MSKCSLRIIALAALAFAPAAARAAGCPIKITSVDPDPRLPGGTAATAHRSFAIAFENADMRYRQLNIVTWTSAGIFNFRDISPRFLPFSEKNGDQTRTGFASIPIRISYPQDVVLEGVAVTSIFDATHTRTECTPEYYTVAFGG